MIRPLLLVLMFVAWTQAPAEPVQVTHQGTTLRGELLLATDSALRDGLVVLLHGTLAHHRMEIIVALQAALAERGHSSLAVNLSLGTSDRSNTNGCAGEHRHKHSDALQELEAWMAWLHARGAGPVALLGHSRGGNQAARYAMQHPGQLSALVLLAPSTHDLARSAARYASRNSQELAPLLERARSLDPSTMMDDVPFLYCGPSRVQAQTFLSYHAPDPQRDTPGIVPMLRVPTLVIAGSDDAVVIDLPARMAALPDSPAKLVVVDGADHFFRDLFMEDVADAVDGLLRAPHS